MAACADALEARRRGLQQTAGGGSAVRRMCVLAGCLLLLLAGCAPQTEYTHTFFAMDTVCSLRLPQKGEQEGEELSEAVQQLVAQLEGLWSKTLPDSEVSRLNAGESLTLEGRTAELLVRSAELCAQTGGAFSPLLGRLTALWDVQNAVRPPQQEQIEALLPVPDADLLQNAAQPGFSLPEGACLDLGGIAKGAAGDAVAQLLRAEGVQSALVVMGGQVGCLGTKPDGSPWQVAVRDPDGEQGESLGTLLLQDTFAVSSGDYERYFEQDGVRYSHILDPQTGSPAQTDLRGVTVVCEDATKADALSTALFVLGSEGALELWRSLGGFEAVLVTADGRLLLTEGLEESFVFSGQERGIVLETVDQG